MKWYAMIQLNTVRMHIFLSHILRYPTASAKPVAGCLFQPDERL